MYRSFRYAPLNDLKYFTNMLTIVWKKLTTTPTITTMTTTTTTTTQIFKIQIWSWGKKKDDNNPATYRNSWHHLLKLLTHLGPKVYSFLSMFLWPFIESYWVAFMGLWSLYPAELVEIKEYLHGAQQFAETLYYRGELVQLASRKTDLPVLDILRGHLHW